MAKPRRPRGPHSTWEPKIVAPGVPEPAHPAPGPAEAEVPAPHHPETDVSEQALMTAIEASPEPVLPARVPDEAAQTEPSAFEASFEAAAPEAITAPPAAPVEDPAPEASAQAAEPEHVAEPDSTPSETPEPAVAEPAPAEPAPLASAREPEPEPEPMAAAAALPEVAARALASAPVPYPAGFPIAFSPERFDMVGIGDVIAGYVRGETQAAAAHARALVGARTAADLIRLNVDEIQRAADASLTCWTTVARKAGRVFSLR